MDIDLLVRAARPTRDEIDADFSRIDHHLLLDQALASSASSPAPTGRPRRGWIGLAAGVAALVIAGSTVAAGFRDALPRSAAPSTLPGIGAAPSAGPSTSAGAGSSAPSRGSAVMALSLVSLNASRQPDPVIPAEQFLHVKFVETQTGDSASETVHDTYVTPDGWTWRHDTGDQERWMLYDADGDSPTTLPSDPVALDAALRSGTGSNSGDERVWKGIDEILMTNAARPKQRAAAIKVLQNLAQHPHSPEMGKEGAATPKVTVNWISLDGGHQGLKATFTDAATRPDHTMAITLDEQGNLVSTQATFPNGTAFASSYPVRELVTELPSDFVRHLGTEKKTVMQQK